MPAKKSKPETKSRPGRPRSESAGVLPIYDSMDACHAATSIPLATLKLAKRKGSSAFRSNRVYLEELLKWIFAQEGEEGDAIDWGNELTKEKAKREKIRRLKDEGKVVERDVVTTGLQGGVALLFSELDRIFLAELPPSVKGLKESAVRAKAEDAIASLREILRKRFLEIGAETPMEEAA